MAVLVLLVVLVGQLVDSATSTVTRSRKHMDADSEARLVLDRMASDIARMVRSSNVDCVVKGWYTNDPASPNTMQGNDTLFFFSEAPGYYVGTQDAREINSISRIGYRVSPKSTVTNISTYALERFATLQNWEYEVNTAGPMPYVTYVTNSSTGVAYAAPAVAGTWKRYELPSVLGTKTNNYSDGTAQAYVPIGQQVFRFEYCYLLKNGTFSVLPYIPPNTSALGLKDVSAIVVAIATLDSTSRKIVDNSQLAKLVSALPDASPSTNGSGLMAEKWNGIIKSANFVSTAGIPQLAASQVRVYQRFFYLNNLE
jgi:hypothetical protein